jgi:hypothetical protein
VAADDAPDRLREFRWSDSGRYGGCFDGGGETHDQWYATFGGGTAIRNAGFGERSCTRTQGENDIDRLDPDSDLYRLIGHRGAPMHHMTPSERPHQAKSSKSRPNKSLIPLPN